MLITNLNTLSYQKPNIQGTQNTAVAICRCIQSWRIHENSPNDIVPIAHVGNDRTNDRYFAGVNSARNIPKTVKYQPHPKPIQKRSAANICQFTEKAAIMLAIIRIITDK